MKYRIALFCFLLFGALFLFLQQTNAYHFFFMEMNQLFLFTGTYFRELVFSPGGLCLYLCNFLLQFFLVPYAGAGITAGLLTLIAMFTALICQRMAPKAPLYVLYLLPAISLLFMHFNFNYQIQGSIAFLFVLIFLYLYMGIRSYKVRLAVAVVSVLLLYFWGGPIVNLYTVCILLWEILYKKEKAYWFIVPVLLGIILCVGSLHFAMVGESRFAFLPDLYFNYRLEPPTVIYFSWISLPIVILITWFFRNRQEASLKREIIESILQLGMIAGICAWGIPKYNDSKSAYAKELDYYSRMGQWDNIVERFQKKATNYLYLCYLNMALAEKGELAERMFTFDQRTTNGLIVKWNQTYSVSALLSSIYFTMGNIALAQEMAFESYVSTISGSNPYMLQRLVQTNLIQGAYPVAEKYLNILDNSLLYREWAKEHRRFLYNDEAVEQDPLLGEKRRNLIPDNYLSNPADLAKDLLEISSFNPENRIPVEYVGAAFLLAKDMNGFKNFLEEYYGTEILPELPRSYQEAIFTMAENDPEYWKKYDLPDDMVVRFQEYKKQVLGNRNSGNIANLLRRSFGDTYWFYYMFK